MERRRDADLPWYWQLVHFVGAPFVDHWRGLSLTRLIAVFCCVAVGNDAFVNKHRLDWIDLCILVLAAGVAFGKMTYEAFLQRLTMGIGTRSTSTTTTTSSEENKG